YYPGIVGLNNIKANDYANVVFHALAHVAPLRNYFLREENYSTIKRPPGDKLNLLPKRFGELIRKLWNSRAFKAHVSPHEMLQAAVMCSEKKFQIIKQSDANDFLTFLLNNLHLGLNGTNKTSSSIIYRTFRGRMRVYSRKVLPVDASDEARRTLLETEEFREKMEETPFLKLTMELPAAPLYRDEKLQNIIPQAAVMCSEKKFQIIKQSDANDFLTFLLNNLHLGLNGTNKTSSSIIYRTFRGRMRVYSRKVLPVDASDEARRTLLETEEFREKMEETPFLKLTMELPAAPLYRDEKLQNIIPQVPLSVLLSKFNGTTEKEFKTYNANFIKRFELIRLPEYLIIAYKRFEKNRFFVEKNPTIVNFPISNVDLYDCISEDARSLHKFTTYDLITNIVHDGTPEKGTYRVQLVHHGTGKWFELEDLHVKEILPQMITLTESYIQIWKLNRSKTRAERIGESDDLPMNAGAAGVAAPRG
uniref:USP domain-containing protein n=1 Tax=Panagrolaimus sp. JU765 TaxID=591449 RepID=A0AC34QEH6_9BILA